LGRNGAAADTQDRLPVEVTYAGFSGESVLLEELHKRGMVEPEVAPSLHAGDGLLMAWHTKPIAPWQTGSWLEQMRKSLRPAQFLRMIANTFVTSESSFIDMEAWDACIDIDAKPVVAFPSLPVWVGVDASVKHDSTAIVAVTWDQDEQKVRLIAHRIFQPSPTEPLDFEAPIESTLTELAQRFTVRKASISMQASQASMSMKLDSLVTNVLAIIRKNCAGRRLLRICSSHDPVCHGAIGLVCHAISKAVASVKARRDFRLYHAALV
jgi:hypothetical protein